MDPLTLLSTGVGVVGLGISLFGGNEQAQLAKQSANISKQEFGVETQQNDVRRQAMEMQGRRSQIETLRVAQRARAMSVQAGTNQGANKGSGMIAGAQHTTAEGDWGLQGIQGQLSFGRQMFGLDDQLNSLKSQQADVQSKMYTAQGFTSLGNSIMKAGPMVGPVLGQGWGATQSAGTSLNWLAQGPTGFLSNRG